MLSCTLPMTMARVYFSKAGLPPTHATSADALGIVSPMSGPGTGHSSTSDRSILSGPDTPHTHGRTPAPPPTRVLLAGSANLAQRTPAATSTQLVPDLKASGSLLSEFRQ